MGKITKARLNALLWFDEHEHAPPHAMLFKQRPSTRIIRLMEAEGQVTRIPVGSWGHERWVLTFAGREALALKGKRNDDRNP